AVFGVGLDKGAEHLALPVVEVGVGNSLGRVGGGLGRIGGTDVLGGGRVEDRCLLLVFVERLEQTQGAVIDVGKSTQALPRALKDLGGIGAEEGGSGGGDFSAPQRGNSRQGGAPHPPT